MVRQAKSGSLVSGHTLGRGRSGHSKASLQQLSLQYSLPAIVSQPRGPANTQQPIADRQRNLQPSIHSLLGPVCLHATHCIASTAVGRERERHYCYCTLISCGLGSNNTLLALLLPCLPFMSHLLSPTLCTHKHTHLTYHRHCDETIFG